MKRLATNMLWEKEMQTTHKPGMGGHNTIAHQPELGIQGKECFVRTQIADKEIHGIIGNGLLVNENCIPFKKQSAL
jgi:hypothetical protein